MRKLLPTLTFIDIALDLLYFAGVTILAIKATNTLEHRGGLTAENVKFNVIETQIPYIPVEDENKIINSFYEEHKRKLAQEAVKSTINIKRTVKRKTIPHNEIVIEPDKIIPQPTIIETLQVNKHNIIFKKHTTDTI